MPSTKRHFLKLSAFTAISSALAGCVTTALYKHDEYTEHVQSLLISEDRKHLIFMTDKFHYIFDAPNEILQALSAPYHHLLKASFGRSRSSDSDFYVESSGKIEGHYTLTLADSASSEFQRMALASGYLPASQEYSSGKGELVLRGVLRGTRYNANNEKPKIPSYYLNERYAITVEAEQSYGRKAANVAATPLTVAADGVITIGSAAAAIICIPFALIGIGFAIGIIAAD